jgi:septum formation protein
MMKKLILATASPRRIEMLNNMGIKFKAVKSFYNEPERKKEQLPSEYVEANAEGKVKSVSKKFHKELIVGSDTVVVYKNRVLGKPGNMNEAFEYIYTLNGKTHSVYTGLYIMNCETGKLLSSHEKTLVTFRNLTESEITDYLNMIDPLDKAGAYAIQGEGALVVEKIRGCYYNVVGFPVSKLESMLLDFGTSLFKYMKR